jgi:hypothetical protein
MSRWLVIALSVTLTGCSQGRSLGSAAGFNTELSAPAIGSAEEETALIKTLAIARDQNGIKANAQEADVKRYLLAGLTLSDIYCDRFFRVTNQQSRRRKFTRSTTNDVGGVVAAVLGLAQAPTQVVGGVAAGFAGIDSTFRGYDDAFLVSPDLSNVRSLVYAAQDSFRNSALKSTEIPKDYMTARTTIVRYAGLCSYLGMQELLNRSLNQQTTLLKKDAEQPGSSDPVPKGGATPPSAPPSAVPDAKPNAIPQ